MRCKNLLIKSAFGLFALIAHAGVADAQIDDICAEAGITPSIRIAQKQYEAAIEVFKHAISLDPKSARSYQLLGEAYVHAKQGSLGAASLNQALKLDPIGSAESHLMLARLYDLAGAKKQASNEYKTFLTKIADHPDKKKFEKYVKDNPK